MIVLMTRRLQAFWWAFLLLLVLTSIPSSTSDSATGQRTVKLDDIDDDCEDGTCDVAIGDDDKISCKDNFPDCDAWSSIGECEKNPGFMLKQCKRSCFVCTDIKIDMGVAQARPPKYADEIHQLLEETNDYLRNGIGKDWKQRPLLQICKNKDERCAEWAVRGECKSNPHYMHINCAPVCFSCDQLSYSARCPIIPEKMPNVWKPGSLNEYFTNVTTLDEYKQYSPQVLSRPDYVEGDTKETADYKIGPWIVTLDNVISEEEATRLIELGAIEGYEGSYAGGKLLPDGTYERGKSDTRTSKNAWCSEECYKDPIAQRVIDRIANITNTPEANSEFLQLLKYDVGEFYKTHHDYLSHALDRQSGVRLMTVFLYLNEPEEGGGTEFPDYDITVQPKRGRALIWPSVKNEDPDAQDDRTEHQALPVVKGVKYGANAWIHQRDFKSPFRNGCN